MVNIKENLYSLNKNIGELKNSIRPAIVAVSKQQNFEKIIEAFKAGQTIFAENYLQEALDKQKLLKEYPIEWHFIGPIQSNKCKLIAENFHWVQTVDRIKIAKRLNDNCINKKINICIQINISEEESKSGIMLDEVDSFASELNQFKQLRLRGIMAIPSHISQEDKLIRELTLLKKIFDNLKIKNKNMDTLSVGMSEDYLLALNYGSTMIRVGSHIFGARK
ncbi:MAG: YggS family pyridoxal phosphate-dependent enzyme [Proteobacteria bacterium]|jgi:pyridoxal phosphate enzyme (YggS family)|nr:YggS family pyridoxal phosphate-dependent enzyme [Pseudomonadota bacterium]MDA0873243.1 YggS family pyridoxal phosphate-dependent enzyme [Pseudomonadota bacterium]MDA1133462.1 YggS family pyridoxal phosphate-dependent enzyme [Pseudomonadota bacterium]